jgi:hypothetical protein
MGVVGKCQAPATLPTVKTWYSLYKWLGGHQGHFGQVQKISSPLGLDPQIVQLVASCYTIYLYDMVSNYE